MRIVVLDYSGHIPQADLAQKLSILGHNVLHLRCTDYVTGTADFSESDDKLSKIEYKGLGAGIKLEKYKVLQRFKHEVLMSKVFIKEIIKFQPSFVIVSNVPLISVALITRKLIKVNIKYIYWWQDVYSLAISNELSRRLLPLFAKLSNKLLKEIERKALKNAKSVVAISDKFKDLYFEWGLDSKKLVVLPNWTPPEDFEVPSKRDDFLNFPYFLYAGTLGLKHNPEVLVDFADQLFKYNSDIKLLIVSEGLGRESLERAENIRENIILSDFVSFERLKSFLEYSIATISILEDSASDYSVPSKIMTYFAAGKAMIAFISSENQAARFIQESNSGIVISNGDFTSALNFAIKIIENQHLRKQIEKNARQFAIDNFSGKLAAELFLKYATQD